jgi:hypothetical protein
MNRNLALYDATDELDGARKFTTTYRLLDQDSNGKTIGDCTIAFISNQYSDNLIPDDGKFDWRVFTKSGKQIQPWLVNTRLTLTEMIAVVRELDPALFDSSTSVLIEAETEMGMKGFLSYDGMGDFYFNTHPNFMSFDQYKNAMARYTDANKNPANHFDGSKRAGTLIGDYVRSFSAKLF